MVTVFVDGENNTFTENEIYFTGASATVWPGEKSIFSTNICRTGHAQSDGSVFQGTKNYVFGSVVHHNFVYDTENTHLDMMHLVETLLKQEVLV